MPELWDICDREGNRTGRLHERGRQLQADEFHLVVDICTVNRKGEILVTKRHPQKHWGGYWECTGGSVMAGEDSRSGAVRELYEETGIKARPDELIFLDRIISGQTLYDEYMLFWNGSLTDLRLQPEEVTEAQWVTLNEFHTMGTEGFLASERIFQLESKIINEIRKGADGDNPMHAGGQ